MHKILMATSAFMMLTASVAVAGSATVNCEQGIRHTLAVPFHNDGTVDTLSDPVQIGANCVAGPDVYIFDVPGSPEVSSMEAAREFVEYLRSVGKAHADADEPSS